jgi:HAD superfamily hydrolase (TIGR01484 family)
MGTFSMFFLALAADYDGTIAHHGVVAGQVCKALERFKQTGRRLVLVTGRDLPSLRQSFGATALFDRIVAENGGLLYDPATKVERTLAPPPPPTFVDHLRQRNVAPLSVGRTIVATWEPNEKIVLEAIRQLGLELQIIFNKGAVMVLPPGVNKATGLAAALRELELSPINVVGIGDAENDHEFLKACGCSACVANALPMLKANVDIVLRGNHGDGVIELMCRVCHEDARLLPRERRGLLLGKEIVGGTSPFYGQS